MINKEIIINKKTRAIINGENGDLFRLGVDGENLQENIIFKFDDEFVNGTGRIEITMQDNTKSYIMINKVNETYVLPVKSIITKTGLNKMQLVITQGTDDEEIPIFKSKMFSFYIADSINADTEQPEGYPQWIDKANTVLNEIDNFDIDAIKELNEATITITDRYGETKSVQVFDGENGQDGKDAKINGVNTLRLLAGKNISLEQEQDELTINAEGGGSSAVTSVNGQVGDVVIEIPDVSDFITKDVNNLTNYEPKATTGNNIVASIDSSTYVMTITLRNSNNETLNSQTIDLPLETMVVNGSYDDTTKKIILTLKNGNTIEFSVADLVSGLQSEITSTNKLSADLVDDSTSTNKFTNATEKATWNAKSDFSGNYNDLTNKPDLSVYNQNYRFNNTSTQFNFDNENLGTYTINQFENVFYYIANNTNYTIQSNILLSINYSKKYSEANTNEKIGTAIYIKSKNNDNRGDLYICDINKSQSGISLSSELPLTGVDNKVRLLTPKTQNIDGVKTLTSIPKQSNTNAPTNNAEFTNKKYVDDQVDTKTIQYSIMPTASSSLLNKIVEYIGTSDSSYTNGYFYKCVSDGESTPTYSWEQVNIQPSFPSDSYFTYINTIENSSSNIFIFENKKKGLYIINNTYNNKKFYYKVKESDNNPTQFNGQPIYLYLFEDFDYDNAENNHIFGYLINIYGDYAMQFTTIKKSSTLISGGTQMYGLLSDNDQSISGIKTFYSIPKQSNTTAPTNDKQFTNKKYVDDSISNAIGSINTILATLTTPSNNS